jgi:hypothetical protein
MLYTVSYSQAQVPCEKVEGIRAMSLCAKVPFAFHVFRICLLKERAWLHHFEVCRVAHPSWLTFSSKDSWAHLCFICGWLWLHVPGLNLSHISQFTF